MIGYIYFLSAKTETDIFYVGSTVNPSTRIISHRNKYPFWVYGCRIQLNILEEIEFNDRRELLKHEIYWIHQLTALGFRLTNHNFYCGKDIRLIQQYIEIDKEIEEERGLLSYLSAK